MKTKYIWIVVFILVVIGILLAVKDKQNKESEPIPPRNDMVVVDVDVIEE